jgi:hypothetical protein
LRATCDCTSNFRARIVFMRFRTKVEGLKNDVDLISLRLTCRMRIGVWFKAESAADGASSHGARPLLGAGHSARSIASVQSLA